MKNLIINISFCILLMAGISCKKYLDIVPDNVATLDNAFANRNEAQKYLFTCYSYLPQNFNLDDDPGMLAGDEIWRRSVVHGFCDVARGFQSVVNPLGDRWTTLFGAIRDCNIFLDNLDKVPDLEESERLRWRSEVLFLKAYYNFYLVRMYGPIPLMKQNLPVDVSEDEVHVYRAPLDSCFSYIVQLLDESYKNLPLAIKNPQQELGRITQPINRSLKAKVLVFAASPLFNGNNDDVSLKDKDGQPLFNQVFSSQKWTDAVKSCKEAIDVCHKAGMALYYYHPDFQQFELTDTIKTQLSIRNSVCEKWNSELIWGNSQYNNAGLQQLMTPCFDPQYVDNPNLLGELSPPLKIVEMYYSNHGVPIDQDKTWNYGERYRIKNGDDDNRLYIKTGYKTAELNFNREPRFYADLAFDGGIWYGQGMYDDKDYDHLFYIAQLFKDINGSNKSDRGTVTGYFIKKLIYYQNVLSADNNYSITPYPLPVIRLADLYLLYAESINEATGPGNEAYRYIDSVRMRAGLPSVEEAWTKYSTQPTEYQSQAGFRKIVHRERLIELAFEGQRFWDLRRWKEAAGELNKPITGWDIKQETSEGYYRVVNIFNQKFNVKDYFWPINENAIERNRNLVQNIGWK